MDLFIHFLQIWKFFIKYSTENMKIFLLENMEENALSNKLSKLKPIQYLTKHIVISLII
jgi:hypothetical protein